MPKEQSNNPEHELYRMYNPDSTKTNLKNEDEKFITEEGEEIDDVDSNSSEDDSYNEDDENIIEKQQMLPPEVITAMLELPDEQLLEYGIENPKQWKSYQRAFTKANQENKALKSRLAQLEASNETLSKIERLEMQLNELKNPPQGKQQSQPMQKPVRPILPKMPANFDPSRISEQGTAEYAYMAEKLAYDQELAIYNEKYEAWKEARDAEIRQKVEAESEIRKRSIQQQQIKQDIIAKLTKRDLTPAEANAAFEMALQPEFYDDELIALGYKLKMGKKVDVKNERTKKRLDKRGKFFLPGIGGGTPEINARKGEFTTAKDTSKFYQAKK